MNITTTTTPVAVLARDVPGEPYRQVITKERTTVNTEHTGLELARLPFPVHLRNQQFALVTYVGPETIPASGGFALRIYGTFATKGEAWDCAEKAQQLGYNFFDLDVVDIGEGFFPLPPPADDELELRYPNAKLGAIMENHKAAVNRGSENVCKRADEGGEQKDPTPTRRDAFEALVAAEALSLFKAWKKQGKADKKAVIRSKLNKRFEQIVKDTELQLEEEVSGQIMTEQQIKSQNLVNQVESSAETLTGF
jgi:hypothetical protein